MQIDTSVNVTADPRIQAANVAPDSKAVTIKLDDETEATITALDVLRLQNKRSRIETR